MWGTDLPKFPNMSPKALLEGRARPQRTLHSELAAFLTDYHIDPLTTPPEAEHRIFNKLTEGVAKRMLIELFQLTYEFANLTGQTPVAITPERAAAKATPPAMPAFRGDDDERSDAHSSVNGATPSKRSRRRSSAEDAELPRSTTTPHVETSTDDVGMQSVNQYMVGATLGRGNHGTVYKVTDWGTGTAYAMKEVIRPAGNFSETVMNEVHISKQLRHDHIVSLHEVIDDPKHDRVYLVMQLINGQPILPSKTLATWPPLSFEDVCDYLVQMAAALRYLERRRIVHKDIKPENILLDQQAHKLYVADFGVSRQFAGDGKSDRSRSDNNGTVAFQAPELFDGAEHTPQSDLWAVGVILYAMIFGRLPFTMTSYYEVRDQVKRGLPRDLTVPDRYEPLAPWLKKLLSIDPARRGTAKELRESGLSSQRMDASATDVSLSPFMAGKHPNPMTQFFEKLPA